uniref:Uncharacterized protein n=1 Tax=Arundo donax TaxID=35708 RepID=A0A0A9GW21_ARUDO
MYSLALCILHSILHMYCICLVHIVLNLVPDANRNWHSRYRASSWVFWPHILGKDCHGWHSKHFLMHTALEMIGLLRQACSDAENTCMVTLVQI